MDLDQLFGTRGEWTHPGARALVLLHEGELRRFHATWCKAKVARVPLPSTEDPAYQSMDALLHHVLRCASGYYVGLVRMLEIEAAAPPELGVLGAVDLAAAAPAFMELLLVVYREAFRTASEDDFYNKTGDAPWGVNYCVDAFFEHAVMHPMRHSLQLDLLLPHA